jgi:hypothetical protein
MPQFYLGDDSASVVRLCNQSLRTRQAVAIVGIDNLTGSISPFNGIVEKVEINQSATKEKRFLVTMTNEAAAN